MIDFTRPGRMISVVKTSPKGNVRVFNANVCSKSRGKFWFGDIDLTDDADDLRKLAADKGEAIYILRERDARFENEAKPRFDNAVAVILPNGTITVGNQK